LTAATLMGRSATASYDVHRISAYGAEAVEGLQDGLANFHAHDALADVRVGVLRVILLGGFYGLDNQENFPGHINLVEV
jgi:hypothetical protein